MNFFKVSFFTSISTLIGLLCGFITTKTIAQFIGPAGLAYTGQFSNSTAIFILLGSAALGSAVVKYIAEYAAAEDKKISIVRTAFQIILSASLIVSIIIIALHKYLSIKIFKSHEFDSIFLFYGIFLFCFTLNNLLTNILNGEGLIKELTKSNICSSIINLISTIVLAYMYNVYGVLLAAIMGQLVNLIINNYFVRKVKWFNYKAFFKLTIDKSNFKKLFSFSLMNVISGLLGPFSLLIIRNHLIDHFSIDDAGKWQSIWRISDYYLSFIISTLSVYYLPKLSHVSDPVELKKEIVWGYKVLLPITGLIALGIWVFRKWVVLIIFTPQFSDIIPLFDFQLLGDFFKISSWLLAYLMVAKAMTKVFIATEIIFNFSFVMLSIFFSNAYGIRGVTMAFAINYFIYLITILIIFRKTISLKGVRIRT